MKTLLMLLIASSFLNILAYADSDVVQVQAVKQRGEAVLGGTVIPYKVVTLSAQLPGRIELVAGEEGDQYDSGTLLVEINDDDILARRRAALAQLSNAEAALRNNQVQYGRELYSPASKSMSRAPGMGMPMMFDNMFTRNFSDFTGQGDSYIERQADLYAQGSGVDQAQALVLSARSNLEELDTKLRDARSLAPFDGMILKKNVEIGDTVQPGQPLLTFGHTKFLRIQAEVPARLVQFLEVGAMAQAYLDVGRTRVEARISQVYPLADADRHTVTVKFDLPMGVPGGPGMYAEVHVPSGEISQQETPVIPATAVMRGGSLPAVLVVNNEGSSELRLLRLGVENEDGKVTVLSGLNPGEQIIDNPPPGAGSGWMPQANQAKR